MILLEYNQVAWSLRLPASFIYYIRQTRCLALVLSRRLQHYNIERKAENIYIILTITLEETGLATPSNIVKSPAHSNVID